MKKEAMSMNIHLPGLFSKIAKEVVKGYDWGAWPPMSEHERVERELAESAGWRRVR